MPSVSNVKHFIYIVFMMLIPAAVNTAAEEDAISIGVQTQIWHDMWQYETAIDGRSVNDSFRKSVAAANLTRYGELNAEWNLVVLRQGRDGNDNFRRAIKAVEEHHKNGIQVVFRLLEDPSVYNELEVGKSNGYGYHREYYRWVRSVAQKFHGQVKFYAIGNEVDHDIRYYYPDKRRKSDSIYVDYNDYLKLLETANKAIKSVNKSLRVINHGPSATSLLMAVADDIRKAEGINAAHAFWASAQDGQGGYSHSKLRFSKMLLSPGNRKKIDVARRSFANPGACDLVQLHYYHHWTGLGKVVEWIRKTSATTENARQIIVTELGYVGPWLMRPDAFGKLRKKSDEAKYSRQEHAADMVKSITILASHGVSLIQVWQMRFHHDKSPVKRLYPAPVRMTDFSENYASRAFREIAGALNGAKTVAQERIRIEGVTEYSFCGRFCATIAWSMGGEMRIPSEVLSQAEEVKRVDGNVLAFVGNGVTIDARPIIIFWN